MGLDKGDVLVTERCDEMYGSHGCKKRKGHDGICVCSCGALLGFRGGFRGMSWSRKAYKAWKEHDRSQPVPH